MPILSDIKKMQSEGKTEGEIINSLKAQGISARDITEALSQSKIKEAVESPAPQPQEQGAEYNEMSPSLSAQPAPQEAQYAQQPQQYQEQYPPQQAQAAISPDTISEISEQVVSEKLAPIRKAIESVLDMKTTVESKLDYMDERLKRIEKIIDRLQLSILQKVGDYMTNIDDIKKEVVETQKSFKSMLPSSERTEKKEKKSVPAE
jgi:DNA-binding transcriptional MerR regulator